MSPWSLIAPSKTQNSLDPQPTLPEPTTGRWRCSLAALVEAFVDVAVMYAILFVLFIIAAAIVVSRLIGV